MSEGCSSCGCQGGDAADAAPTEKPSNSVLLSVPGLCCPTEFGMVDKALRRVAGVRDVTPDFVRKAVRVEHDAVGTQTLLEAARASGLEVQLPTVVEVGQGPAERSTVRIDNMDCPTEEALIRKRLDDQPWVTGLSFNLMQRTLTVDHAPGRQAELLKALGDVGMVGQVLDTASQAPAVAQVAPSASHRKLLAAGLLAMAAEAVAYWAGERAIVGMALALAAIALSGLETYRKGWFALRQRNLNINALMSVAVTGALLLGQWPEAAMVMVLFAVAELIEARSLDRARHAVEGLMAMAPQMATVQSPTGWREIPAAEVSLGAVLRVRPGERIALDGQVTAGASAVDQSPITGESVPVDKAQGDPVFAGTINQHAEIEVRVSALASHSTLARIVHAVQEAQGSRAPTQRFVDTFSAYYTPSVFVLALALALVPPLAMGADWFTWIYRALVMLVIACPCALVISTPVSVVSGLTAAARRGILIKGGLYLEQGHRLKLIALDKTGTLTEGRPTLTDTVALQGSAAEVAALALSLAARSDHPVSRAVATALLKSTTPREVTAFKALQGRGVEGDIAGITYRLGNHRLVEESLACSPALEARLSALEQQGKTAIVLTRGSQALAIYAIADAVRAHSAEAVAQLHALGVATVMLTGDNRHTAEAIAAQVGITEVRSEQLPEGKLRAIEAFVAQGAVVGMVGDGINDAPALARADIGFAMGAAGTDTAIETADVTLMDDDPRKLAEFVRLSRATRAVLWQNIALALGIKAVFLALAMAGQATLWMAVFADMGASLLVVFNGLRLLRWRTDT
ncbi:MAG: cadmium-translocating P-type ATPase [Vitreoscilla sp.]|nr:cadmium-translocating P-type ATPase [Vitreoscilla sp.]